jgi:hypothetical protein
MDEVVGGGGAGKGAAEGCLVGEIRGNDFEVGVAGPGAGLELAGGADKAADAMAAFEQPGDETAADITGGAGDGNKRHVTI